MIGGLIAGALGGAGSAMASQAQSEMAREAEMGKLQMLEELAMQRADAMARLKQKYAREDEEHEDTRRKEKLGQFEKREKELMNEGAVSDVNKAYGTNDLTDADLLPEEKEAFATEKTKQAATKKAALETGLIGMKESIAMDREDRRADREDKKLSIAEMKVQLNDAATQARLEMDGRKLEAMIKGMGAWAKSAGGGSVSSFVQDWALLEKKFPNATADEILSKIKQGKEKADEWSQRDETDPVTGETKTITTRKGSGEPPTKPAGSRWIFKDGKLVPSAVK